LKDLTGSHSGKGLRIAVVTSRFIEEVTSRLHQGCLEGLRSAGVSSRSITKVWVPGAFEIPGAAAKLAEKGKIDAVVCLGAVIRGETEHFTYVCKAAQEGILAASLATGVPMSFGVLTTDDFEQALDRAGGRYGNKGYEAAFAAVEMANLYRIID